MSEEIVREAQNALPEYVTIEQIEDKEESLRITNTIIDALNGKNVNFIETIVTSTNSIIPFMPEYGAFIICVQGEDSGMPTATYACCSSGANGSVGLLVQRAGEDDWAGVNITITAVGGNFQIVHTGAATLTAKFYLTILGYF